MQTTGQARSAQDTHAASVRGFRAAGIALCALAFVTYPLAVAVPVRLGVSLVFHVALPSFFLVTLGTLFLLLCCRLRAADVVLCQRRLSLPGALRAALLGVTGVVCFSAWLGDTADPAHVVSALGAFAIPVAAAAAPRCLYPRRLVTVFAALWAVHAAHGLIQLGTGYGMVAVAGNRNWAATMIIVGLAWVWTAAVQRRGRNEQPPTWYRDRRLWAAAGATIVSLYLVHRAQCRATWLVLALYLACHVLAPRFTWLGRGALASLPVLALVAALLYAPDRLTEALDNDIRLPLYASTVRMITGRPWFGVGPGNFRREFVPYRSAAHKARRVAAPVTEHPHNEFLHLAAIVGLPLALVWLCLLYPLARAPRPAPFWRAAHFSAWMLYGHGCLDKVLVRPPMSVLAAVFLGLLWRRHLRLRAITPAWDAPWRHRLACGLGAMAFAAGLWVSVREVRRGIHFRSGYLLESRGHYRGAYRHYAASAQIAPRDVRTHTFAGMVANNKLRDHSTALRHFREAARLEPDFAHLNGQIGLALGALKRHEEALPFFAREARLFPYDAVAHRRLFFCGLATRQATGMHALHQRIHELSARDIAATLGLEQAEQLATAWQDGCQAEDGPVALDAANALLATVSTHSAEPALFAMTRSAPGLATRIHAHGFGPADWRLWRAAELARQAWGDAERHDWDHWERLRTGTEGPDEYPDALWITHLAHAGGGVAVRTEADTGGSWELVPLAQVRDPGTDTDPPTGADSTGAEERRFILHCHPLQFLTRTQLLSAVGNALGTAAGPNLNDSPELLRRGTEKALATRYPNTPVTVVFVGDHTHLLPEEALDAD